MDIKAGDQNRSERVLASLSPESLDRLADLVIAKLTARNGGVLLPKQDVAGSNPITRSIKLGDDLLIIKNNIVGRPQ